MSTNDHENMLAEIRADIKTLISEQAAIKSKLPQGGLSCALHEANISRCQEDIRETRSDIKWLTKKFYISYGVIIALLFILEYAPSWIGVGQSRQNKPTSAMVAPATNHFVWK